MGAKEKYEARKAAQYAKDRTQKEVQEKSHWWFRQSNPIDRFTGWLVTWTALLFIGTIISAAILYKTDLTLRETQITSQRPWVSGEIGMFSFLVFDEEGMILPIKITMKNTGQSPAVDIAAYVVMFIRSSPPMTTLQIQQERCERGDVSGLAPNQGIGYTLFPGEMRLDHVFARMDRDRIAAEGGNLESITPSVVVCINYKSTFENRRHRTASIYRLGKSSSRSPGYAYPMDLLKEPHLKVDQLTMMYEGSYAD